jgi:alpha-L-fucosidase 2
MRRHITRTFIAGGLILAGAALTATQAPSSPRFTGQPGPPSSELSLWYRAPASDRPLAAPEAKGGGANPEWVRALPVGNGRLGAMVFGGVVYEQLQLNEDTLWAGRPYNPVNPDAKEALPEVRRLLAARQYTAAAKLVSDKVMAKPLAQMPYQTLGHLALTFPQVESVENYRRHLDLATARVTTSGVTFTREVFANAPDQVIVVRLTASRPGQISVEARMQTPQRATVEAIDDGDIVMRGVNGDGRGATADGRPMTGALKFEARVRVLATGGTRTVSGSALVVRGADAVTMLIAAATRAIGASTTCREILPRVWPRRSAPRRADP